jgi:hypothetical protein
MDHFILGSTLLVFAALVQAVVTAIMANREKTELATRIDRWCRPIFLAAFLLVILFSFARPT